MTDVRLSEKLSQNSRPGYSAKNGGSYLCLDDFSPEIALGLPEYKYDFAVDQVVARYYDATIGRFISADIFVTDPTNPQSLNRYSYCVNNPLKYIDPSGYNWGAIWDSVFEATGITSLSSPLDVVTACAKVNYYSQTGTAAPDWDWDDTADYLGVDSDWFDVLRSASWGDRLHLQTKNEYVTDFVLTPGMETLSQLAYWFTETTLQRDQGNIHTLRLYSGVTGDRLRKAKPNDGHGWWDRNGGTVIVVATAVGGCLVMATGVGIIAYGACVAATGATIGTTGAVVVYGASGVATASMGYGIMDFGLQVSTVTNDKQLYLPSLPPGVDLHNP